MIKQCPVCSSANFSITAVLWPELISQWQLNTDEVDYINRQQGLSCDSCGSNLRSMALASAILASQNLEGNFRDALSNGSLDTIRVLEINPAGTLSTELQGLAMHRLVEYPEFDMHNLNLPDDQFDLVVHSDTLEHIEQPVLALTECQRVLNSKGSCVFTVPIIPARLTRSRSGMPPSYHGAPHSDQTDLLVHWEFGADFWTMVIRAGFTQCTMLCEDYPGGVAIVARN